jgi:protease-4
MGIGLVDSFGGLNDAVREAAKLAGLEEYRTVERPEAVDFYTALLQDMTGEMRLRAIRNELGEASKYYLDLKELLSAEGIQARMPYLIDIH